MYLAALIVPFFIAAAVAQEAPIVVKGYPWAPFISPMGEPFRARPTGEAPIARWFAEVDRNRDGTITPDELLADADRFFARLDGNRDGRIDPEEIKTYEWEIAPEVQVNSQWKRPRGVAAPPAPADSDRERRYGRWPGEDEHDGYRTDGLQGAARYALLNIPQPVAGADADFNRLITLEEFRQAAAYRFKLLDDQRLGRLGLQELEARLPARPKRGDRIKRRKDSPDPRIGLPLPESD